ncbi:hypothetical protein L6452_12115 [Arctium lappa]|uniref:Uncharacterized protein n=1 Tax=Arctium lappa TaxID=4217 RepID=A0ACB9DQM0_ARCLA|nr:hypothetical protein L6452_12115 [Arctium lappa]
MLLSIWNILVFIGVYSCYKVILAKMSAMTVLGFAQSCFGICCLLIWARSQSVSLMTIGNDVCKFKDYMIMDMGLNFATVVYLDFGNWYYNFLLPQILDNFPCTIAGLFGFWHQLLFKVFSWDRRNKEGHLLLEFDLDIPMTYGQIGPFLTYVALLYLNDWAYYYHVMVGCGDDAIDATNSRMVEFIVGLSLENFILGRYLKNFNAIEG